MFSACLANPCYRINPGYWVHICISRQNEQAIFLNPADNMSFPARGQSEDHEEWWLKLTTDMTGGRTPFPLCQDLFSCSVCKHMACVLGYVFPLYCSPRYSVLVHFVSHHQKSVFCLLSVFGFRSAYLKDFYFK